MSSSLQLLGAAAPDFSALIAGLFIYPVKSCGGMAVPEAELGEHGLALDRNWMVVDAQGQFLTQRELPRMALIQPSLRTQDMVLRAPGMLALHVSLHEVNEALRVQVWNDEVPAFDMGPIAAQWFSDFLGISARLVRFDPEHQRPSSRDWTGERLALNQFSDGYPMLLTSQASLDGLNERLLAAGESAVTMARFRPNIVLGSAGAAAAPVLPHDEDRLRAVDITTGEGRVRLLPVKPCPRCLMVNNHPMTAEPGHAVMDALQRYRQDPRLGGALSFGMNVITLDGVGQRLRVGQAVAGSYLFED